MKVINSAHISTVYHHCCYSLINKLKDSGSIDIAIHSNHLFNHSHRLLIQEKGDFLKNSTKFIKEINIKPIQHVSSLKNYIAKNSKGKLWIPKSGHIWLICFSKLKKEKHEPNLQTFRFSTFELMVQELVFENTSLTESDVSRFGNHWVKEIYC